MQDTIQKAMQQAIPVAMPAAPPRLALYQPDIAPNAGTLARLCACLGVPLDIIEPAGFDVSDRNFRRAGMDYLDRATIIRHDSWAAFEAWRGGETPSRRLILAETDGEMAYVDFAFAPGDVILLGRESAGVPDAVRASADGVVRIPQVQGARSINVALAGAMMLGEALRQLRRFPTTVSPSPETPDR
jgi:tRNA (cytidine/uridine-2'-O-)-methyltransferase